MRRSGIPGSGASARRRNVCQAEREETLSGGATSSIVRLPKRTSSRDGSEAEPSSRQSTVPAIRSAAAAIAAVTPQNRMRALRSDSRSTESRNSAALASPVGNAAFAESRMTASSSARTASSRSWRAVSAGGLVCSSVMTRLHREAERASHAGARCRGSTRTSRCLAMRRASGRSR